MRKNWLLPFTNILCLIHCVGVGLFSASAPLWLAGLHYEWLEYLLIAFNLIVGIKVFKSLPTPKYRQYVLVFGLTVATIGLFLDLHDIYHGAIVLTALYQITTLIQFHNKKIHQSCECLGHELTKSQHIKQKKLSKLMGKWQKEPLIPGQNEIWTEFEKDLKEDRFHIPEKKD